MCIRDRELPPPERYQHLLGALRELFPCNAVALLRLDGDCLLPLAVDGLSHDTLGRRFRLQDHPRLLTLLGLTHEAAAECLPLCLGLLRAAADTADAANTAELPPTDALLGAAAIVARTQPGALLPDLAALKADPQAAQAMQLSLIHI